MIDLWMRRNEKEDVVRYIYRDICWAAWSFDYSDVYSEGFDDF